MTGSKPQLYNGIALLATFFLCRLVWGTYQSAIVYSDMWHSVRGAPSPAYLAAAFADPATAADRDVNLMFFQPDAAAVPVWLTVVYLAANLVLNALNWYWFVKMVAAVRKRFEPPKPGKGKAAVPAGNTNTNASASAVEDKDRVAVRQRRAPSIIEGVVPDSEELREGTIQ
jgi:hypothetical protein